MNYEHIDRLIKSCFIQNDHTQSPYFLFAVYEKDSTIMMLIPIYFCPICGKQLEISGNFQEVNNNEN